MFHQLGRWKITKTKSKISDWCGRLCGFSRGEHIRHRAPYVDIVFGPQTLHRLPEMINQIHWR